MAKTTENNFAVPRFTLPSDKMQTFLNLAKSRGQIDIIKYNYIWRINNFSELCGQKSYEGIKSPSFSVSSNDSNGHSKVKMWSIYLFPNGETEKSKNYISLFVQPQLSSNMEGKFAFSILNNKMKKTNEISCTEMMQSTVDKQKWGLTKFIKRNFLLHSSEDLLAKDTLTILCEVTVNSIDIDTAIRVQVKAMSKFLKCARNSLWSHEK